MVAALELGYRRGDGGAFLTARAKPPLPLEVPAPALTAGTRVDYYVRALDEHGGVLAESGAPTLPFRLQVAAPPVLVGREPAPPARWYQRWWVWTIVGAVAAGAGAVAYVETRPESLLTISGPTAQ